MEFVSPKIFLGVVSFVCCTSVSMKITATATTTTTTTTTVRGPNTTGQVLWSDYASYPGTILDTRQIYNTTIPFTYYEYKAYVIEVNIQGVLSFGSVNYVPIIPPIAEWPYLPKLFSVYWSQLIPSKFNADAPVYTYYDSQRLENVTHNNSLIKYIKDVLREPEFEPLAILAVTWENIRPSSGEPDVATFQVLIATDSRVTYAIRGYQFVWQSRALAIATYYAATYSRGIGDRPKISTPGSHIGPEVIRLGTKKPNKDAYTCVQKTQIALAHLNSSLNLLPPCPCYQASIDQQFTTVADNPRCYQSKTPPAGGSLLQLCCYNLYGHLMNYTREARVPVTVDPTDHRLQEAYEKCCTDGFDLCFWFYGRIYQTKCTDYTPAYNESNLPVVTSSYKEKVLYFSPPYVGVVRIEFNVRNSTPVTYSISTTFNSSHGIRLDGNVLIWSLAAFANEMHTLTFPRRLVFYATDTNNMSISYAPILKLCLCVDHISCTQDSSISLTRDKFGIDAVLGGDSIEIGNVNTLVCDCWTNTTGRLCLNIANICDNCLVQKPSGCDNNTRDYCPPCPLGYLRNGTQCIVDKWTFSPDQLRLARPRKIPKSRASRNSVSLLIMIYCIASCGYRPF